MHPHDPLEDRQINNEHYAIYSRLWVGEYAQDRSYFVGSNARDSDDGYLGLVHYNPLLSATITADIESPVQTAEFRLHLGTGTKNLSPYMTGGLVVNGRPLFDPGRYVTLETKCVSRSVLAITPPVPRFQAKGTFVATNTAFALSVPWPAGHQSGDYALLIMETANQAPTIVDAAGFTQLTDSPQSTGTAGSTTATRLTVYGRRATGSAMVAPKVSITGDHLGAQVITIRGCDPNGTTPVHLTAGATAASSTAVSLPTMSPTEDRCAIVQIVAAATDTTTPQVTWALNSLLINMQGNIAFFPAEVTDTWSEKGNGGGFSVLVGGKNSRGTIGITTATLATASVQAKLTIALRAPASFFASTAFDDIPWRPVFAGVIDAADPADDEVLVLQCRDVYADVLGAWIEPSPLMNWEMPEEKIEVLLEDLLDLSPATVGRPPGILFSVIGVPPMLVPAYFQEPGSVLLAMRTAGLQSGWDLRGRWGTPPYAADEYVLTYYEPDRAGSEGKTSIFTHRYYTLHGLRKSRDEVRNVIWVKPSDPPRAVVERISQDSVDKYRRQFMMVAEDVISLIKTPDQAAALADAILSDLAEPKVMAEIEMRFMPFIEINDTLEIWPNDVQHDDLLPMAVSGYTHTIKEDGDAITVIRTRNAPAAANHEWRRGEKGVTEPTQYTSTLPPSGSAVTGSRWTQVD